jgi:hypothetical protein
MSNVLSVLVLIMGGLAGAMYFNGAIHSSSSSHRRGGGGRKKTKKHRR